MVERASATAALMMMVQKVEFKFKSPCYRARTGLLRDVDDHGVLRFCRDCFVCHLVGAYMQMIPVMIESKPPSAGWPSPPGQNQQVPNSAALTTGFRRFSYLKPYYNCYRIS